LGRNPLRHAAKGALNVGWLVNFRSMFHHGVRLRLAGSRRGALPLITFMSEIELCGCVGRRADWLGAIVQGRVPIPSESTPSTGYEQACQVSLQAAGGILPEGLCSAGAIGLARHLLVPLEAVAARRRESAPAHSCCVPSYCVPSPDPVPVLRTRSHIARWGTREPITIPEIRGLASYWLHGKFWLCCKLLGERRADVARECFEGCDGGRGGQPRLFPERPVLEFPRRWLSGSFARSESLVSERAACQEPALEYPPAVAGIEGPCN
jgi:hypothetical protein